MMRRHRTTSSCCRTFYSFESFPFLVSLTPKGEKIVTSINFLFLLVCNGLCCTCVGHMGKNSFMLA
jgi:hypothetical protein